MTNRLMPGPGPSHDTMPRETTVDGFTDFFRKAKALDCFPDATDAPLSHTFADRRLLRSEDDGQNPTLAGDEAKALWKHLSATPVNEKRAAYIHVPFGRGKALDNGSGITPITKELSSTYADAVICDLMRDGAQARQQGGPIHALYFGGGTPTTLSPKDLGRVLEAACRNLPLANDCEITIEGRISDMTPDMIRACIGAGANRFALNVLTFQTELRRSMGFKAERKEVIHTLSALKATDQAAIIIDLVYGLPGQTPEIWQKDLNTLFALELDGVHLYQVGAFKGAPQATGNGSPPPLQTFPARPLSSSRA